MFSIEGENTLNSKNSSPDNETKTLFNADEFLSFSDDQAMKKKQNKTNELVSSRTPVANQLGHRHSSSYDTCTINTNIEFSEVF